MSFIGDMFGGGGGSDVPQPDPAIGQAAQTNAATGKEMAELGREQLAWNKQQYAELAPQLKQILDQQVKIGNLSADMASQQWDHYQTTYLPVEKRMAEEAMAEGSASQQESEAAKARADVAGQYEDARAAQERDMALRGINPASPASMSLDRTTRTSQATSEAGAMNNARTNARMRGIALRTGVAQFGRNMPATGIAADQTALGAGSSAAATGVGSIAAGNAGVNSAMPWYSGGVGATQAAGNLYLGQFGGNIQAYAARSGANASMMGGLGSAAGYFFGGSKQPWILGGGSGAAKGGIVRKASVERIGYARGGMVRRAQPVARFGLGGFVSDVLKFEKSKLGNLMGKYKDDPERPLLGINTPFESKVWGSLLGKDYEPTVDMFGGATKDDVAKAKGEGINTGPGESMHNIARAITSLFAMNYAGGAMPSGGVETAPITAPAAEDAGATGAFDMYGSQSSPTDARTVFDEGGMPAAEEAARAPWQRFAQQGTQMQGGGSRQPATVDQTGQLVAPYQAPQQGDIAQMQADILARLQALSPGDRQNLAALLQQQYGVKPPKQYKRGGMVYAGGGMVKGPGTGTSDSVPAIIDGQQPAALSNGEAVLNKPAVDLVGEDFIHRVNKAGLMAARKGVRYARA